MYCNNNIWTPLYSPLGPKVCSTRKHYYVCPFWEGVQIQTGLGVMLPAAPWGVYPIATLAMPTQYSQP